MKIESAKDFFNKLLGKYEAPEKTKEIEIYREKGAITTSNGKDPKYSKSRTIINQKGAFGKGGRGYANL